MRITVVGAGVIGLTCAVELEAAGHDVTVIGEHTGDATVSSVAGEIWFPYRAGPPDRVARWAARARARLEALVAVPDAVRLGLLPGAVIAVRTGLRPFRPEVRLERVGRVIHCYGHDGAGFTLAIGCAEDVVALV